MKYKLSDVDKKQRHEQMGGNLFKSSPENQSPSGSDKLKLIDIEKCLSVGEEDLLTSSRKIDYKLIPEFKESEKNLERALSDIQNYIMKKRRDHEKLVLLISDPLMKRSARRR